MPALLAFLLTLLSPLLALAQAGPEDSGPNLMGDTFWGAIAFGVLLTVVAILLARRVKGPPYSMP